MLRIRVLGPVEVQVDGRPVDLGATASLQAYVSKLRRLLEPGRSPRAPARLLVSAPPGYVLRVPRFAAMPDRQARR
jgi:DNA-binding SARP family transcriptional activator